MKPPDKPPSRVIEVMLRDLNGTYILSFTMESAIPISEILERRKRGDPIVMLELYSMMSSKCLKYANAMSEANLLELSTETPLSGSKFTFSLSQLLHISWLYETLVKRLESLRQKLTRTEGSERHITLQELRQVDFHLALMTSELVEISKTLKKGSVESS